jgi:eukaryotic-like serine/threonine-protein kinase
MPFASSTDLLDWLDSNLFLNAEQVEELRPISHEKPDLYGFAKEMLRRDWMTPFQINQILKDNADNLIVGCNRLQMRLGEGAMGQVYKAWNVRLGRVVAVKMLHGDHMYNGKAMERFRREMQTTAQLDHPNIVLVRDADEIRRIPYLVMDFIIGVDLAQKVKNEGPQPLRESVEYIRQAALGCQHAFERGIVHRDLKPSNMILTRNGDGSPLVRILDFGLARFEREETDQKPLTQMGRILGTVDFIAPEQAQDAHRVDVRADIYSLGCTLYYLLTGQPPFVGADQLEKLTARLSDSAPPLRHLRADAPAELEAVVAMMLARLPTDRYSTPIEVAQALAPFSLQPPSMELPRARAPMAIPVAAVAPQAAKPVAAPDVPHGDQYFTEPEAPGGYPFGDDGGASHHSTLDAEADSTETTPRRTKFQDDDGPAKRPVWPWLVGGAVALLLAVGGAGSYFLFVRPIGPVVPPGTMTISLDNPPTTWQEGKQKPIIVLVKRSNFSGPVSVEFESLPDGLRCEKVVIPAAEDRKQLDLQVSWHTQGFNERIFKIVAKSPNSAPAYVEIPITVTNILRR